MNGFLEITSAILRMGPSTLEYGDDFELAAEIAGDGHKATVKALVSPRKLFSRTYMHDAFRILRDANWKSAHYEHEGEKFTVDLTHEPFIIRKESPMSIDESAKQVNHHLAKALELAAAGKTDFVPLIEAVIAAHPGAVDLAKTENIPTGQRLRDPRLLALADAGDALSAAGMADPDQGHPLHTEIIKAIHGAADISEKVHKRDRDRLPAV